MRYIDADGHVEESPTTFSDTYLDPAFRAQRPRVVGVDGMVYWVIDEQLFPRRVGRGCNNLGTPTSHDGKPALHTIGKPESPACMELTDIKARVQIMDEEDIAVQVVYTTLFLAYPLSTNPAYVTALCSSYNRWLGDILSGHERIKWAAVVNLDEVPRAVGEVHEAKRLGAAAVMVLGTAGDHQLDDPSFFPFYEALCEERLPLAVHVGWACPSINNLYSHIYPSGVVAFHFPVLMGFAALISGGILDRFPNLTVVFLEAGCMWIPFMIDRLEHRYQNQGKNLAKFLPQTKPLQKLPTMDYVKRGTLYFSAELEDFLLPQVTELVGENQIVMGTDMPHGDRERFAARLLQERKDLSAAAKANILERNPARLYGLAR
ncbi:MAG TPA: amidohydrolase family protein [Candidatus Binatia bacterium]|jgi:predicted TIM-barrel fold metal-dependent hydrolase|nr:amidohydrolase family protein [Candidatus Binatia bacterium]